MRQFTIPWSFNMRWFLLLVALTVVNCEEPFEILFSWKQMDYNFPNDTLRDSLIASGDYVQINMVPTSLNVWGDKLFLTIPRWKTGVAANLNYINITEAIATKNKSPLLNPYPSWDLNNMYADGSIVNGIRVRIDECDRLWTVDSGLNDMLGDNTFIHPIKLVAIDLNTDEIVLSYTFKDTDITDATFFADIVIDVDSKNCNNGYVYISDLGSYAVVVYSMAQNDSWRIIHNYFNLDPLNSFYNVNGTVFQWTDGVFGMALSNPKEDGYKTLYFHAFGSLNEFEVCTSLLQNQTALADPHYFLRFHLVGCRGPNTQSTSSMFEKNTDIIYFTQINRNAVSCWDTHTKLNPQTFRTLAQDNQTLIFPNDVIIQQNTKQLYCLSNKLQLVEFGVYNPDDTNFYVHVASLEDTTAICQQKSYA